MKFLRLFTIVLSLLLLTSCVHREYKGTDYDLYGVAMYSIPGVGDETTTISIIEQDSYGRTLFRAVVPSGLYGYGNDGIAYAICQKSDKQYTYFYPNVCYFLRSSQSEFTDELLTELKLLNDWESELCEQKMIGCKLPSRRNLYKNIDYDDKDVDDSLSVLLTDDQEMQKSIIRQLDSGELLIFARSYNTKLTMITEVEPFEVRAVFDSYANAYIVVYDPQSKTIKYTLLEDMYDHNAALIELIK